MTQPADIQLNVQGMTCEGCVASVRRIVQRADPDAIVSIDLAKGALTAKTQASAAKLIEAINAGGYQAKAA